MADKPEKRATIYVVFDQDDAGGWIPVADHVEAANGRAAIGKVAKAPGRYAAVPERSWTEETVAFEPQPAKLVFGQNTTTVAAPEKKELADTDLGAALEEVDAQVAAV